ncbi:MAG: rRNA pseudouridine synthase [Oscillospiraceae bacterium]|nr:rRNA pseudouridine synthase [Oscillospiraceae bacterium]
MDKLIRLDKFLSSQLNISRTDAKKLIAKKRISFSSSKPVRPETQIDTCSETVFFDGKEINFKKFLYIAQNKPAGVVSASNDDSLTVIDILPENLKRQGLFPAGRLDKDSTGFVLITDDGEFAHNILSPSKHIEKTYIITLLRNVTERETLEVTEGMVLGDEKLKPAKLKKLEDKTYEITLTQGRYHQIKRMFGSFDNPVQTLHRIKIGSLLLPPELSPGESRELTSEEIKLIK